MMLEASTILPIVLGVGVGIAIADLIAGIVHWACDTWGSEETPWLGASLIFSFREHHHKPTAMLAHDWIDVNGGAASAAFVALVAFEILIPWGAFGSAPWFVFATSVFFGLVITSALANQLHYWSHTRDVPPIVKSLQCRGVILSRAEHARHHRAPHTHGYCISTGWLNRPLDAIGFWRTLETWVSALTGAQPRRDQKAHRVGP